MATDRCMANAVFSAPHRWLLVSLQTVRHPTDAEWEGYLADCRLLEKACGGDFGRAGVLVVTDGGAPTARQRESLRAFLGDRRCRVAIVTSSLFARGVATALSWFNRDLRCYPPARFAEALRHLQLDASDEAAVRDVVTRLAAELPDMQTVTAIRRRAA